MIDWRSVNVSSSSASALLLSLLLCAGCPPAAVSVRPYPAPTAPELLAQLQRSRAQIQTLRAYAKADYMDRGQRVKIDLALLAERPQKLRLAGENSLTGPLLTVATDGNEFHLLDVRENRFLRGQVNPCNMSRILGLTLHPSQLIEVLMGGTPLLPDASESNVSWDPREGGRDVLTLRNARGISEVLRFSRLPSPSTGSGVAAIQSPGIWDLREAEGKNAMGTIIWRLRHEDFSWQRIQAPGSADSAGPQVADATAGSVRVPSVTYLEDPPRKSDVRLRWREREWNIAIDAKLFQLDAPEGIPVEPDTCSLPPASPTPAPSPAPSPAPTRDRPEVSPP